MNPFTKLKAALGDVAAIRRGLLDRKEKHLQRLDELHALPLAKPDILDSLNAVVNSGRAEYLERLEAQLGAYLKGGRGIEGLPPNMPLLCPNSGQSWTSVSASAILGLFPEEIKRAIAQAVDGLDLPEGGPLLSERRAEMEKIDKELSKIEAELAELEAAANSAGVVLQ
jgi:hypothetical protein